MHSVSTFYHFWLYVSFVALSMYAILEKFTASDYKPLPFSQTIFKKNKSWLLPEIFPQTSYMTKCQHYNLKAGGLAVIFAESHAPKHGV